MAERIGTFISTVLENYLPPEVIVFIVSMMPILELRGGFIVATLLGVPWQLAWVLCVVANLIPIVPIIYLIRKVLSFLQKHGPIKRFANWIEEHGTKRGEAFVAKYPKSVFIGLFLFVAIPLPGTGAWTGSLIAALMGIPPKKAIPALALGVLGCSLVMITPTYLIPYLITLF